MAGRAIAKSIALVVVTVSFALAAATARAETKVVRIAKQFGISYLPLTLMEENKLLETYGSRLGLELGTQWMQLTGGTPINEALISGSIDFASGGVTPLLVIWGKSRGNVKGIAALNSMPLYLNTIDPDVASIRDFTEKDRIALPAVKVSIQAITLQMAAEQAFGAGHHDRLDRLTVSLSHPDGLAQMLSRNSEITAHFTSAPFMYQELEDKRVKNILDSYEVLGGAHTFNLVWTSERFYAGNRRIVEAFIAALADAIERIRRDPAGAAALWCKAEGAKLSSAEAERIIRLPENEWTMVPKKVMAYAQFMSRVGMLAIRPARWQDVFFDDVHKLPGN
jgi:NitT/TauT family transport system substrate-binding protein